MYDNIGAKIKGLAIAYFIIATIAQIIYGIYLLFELASGLGFLLILVSPLSAWVSSWLLYGFGQLIENSDYMVSIKQKEEEQQHHTEENE